MAGQHFSVLLRLLRRRAGEQVGGGLSDGALLDRFVRQRDEAAFEALFWRHGPMVLAVCRRLLPPADAEDAFQATFLILVRKAASIGRREAVGAWLYRVAYRVALRARATARPVAELPPEGPAAASDEEAAAWRDLRPLLDEAIASLPEKYRAPVVLCYLEGKTNQEASRELGCPKGTVAIRLMRARERLRRRLGRRGLLLPAALLGTVLTGQGQAEALEGMLAQTTLKAALGGAAGGTIAGVASPHATALAQGVLRAMFLSKVKLVVLFLVAQGLIVGGGVWWHAQSVAAAAPQPNDEPPARTAPGSDERRDLVDVVSAREGILEYLGTEIVLKAGEKPPRGAFKHEMTLLVTEGDQFDPLPHDAWVTIDGRQYRPLGKRDEVRPNKVRIHRVERWFLPVKEGTKVQPGQLLGLTDPVLAVDELASRLAKFDAAEADRIASEKIRDFYKVQYDTRVDLFRRASATREELAEAKAGYDRSIQETISKGEAVKVAARELRQAETMLGLHQVRSRVSGVVTKIYKHTGEGVKSLEPVLQVRLEEK
jgi:RNA polymerase sigma factor (sigma-70 family)